MITNEHFFFYFFLYLPPISSSVATVSVRNNRNVPKPPLTVKPDPNDTLNRSINQVNGGNSNSLYYYDSYSKPDLQASSNSLYMNGQQQQHLLQEPVQHQYAVVKKSGSKRDIRENLERENSAIIKVSLNLLFIFCILNVTHCIKSHQECYN